MLRLPCSGFAREVTFEGQAAMWLEQLARERILEQAYPFPFDGEELDFRPLLQAVVRDRLRGREAGEIARAFQRGIATVSGSLACCFSKITDWTRLSSREEFSRTSCCWRI